ncbi:MAG TPA: DUF3054 domain-containing protein [Ktedonobacteraceae bacterium]|jgi:hypothetical protein
MATKEHIPDTLASKDTLEDQGRANIGRIILLIIGDAIVFLIFAAVGRRSHGEAASISSFLQVAGTAAPFALGWFIVAPFIGAYRRRQTTGVGNMAQRTALSWIAAWPVAILFRGIAVDRAVPPWTFMLISLISNMVFLEVWRVLFAWLSGLKRRAK